MKSFKLVFGGLICILFFACQPAQTSKSEKTSDRQKAEAEVYNIEAMNTYNKSGIEASAFVLSKLDTALILDPDNIQTYKNKASVLAACKRYDEAQTVLKIAGGKCSKDYQLFVLNGFIEEKLGNAKAAKDMYKIAISACKDSINLYPDSAYFWAERAFFERLSVEEGSKINPMKQVLNKFPDNADVKMLFEMFENNPNFKKDFIDGLFNDPKIPD